MYYIQYKLRESDQHFTMSGVETFWVEEGHLVIVQKDIKPKTTLKLIDLEYFYLTKQEKEMNKERKGFKIWLKIPVFFTKEELKDVECCVEEPPLFGEDARVLARNISFKEALKIKPEVNNYGYTSIYGWLYGQWAHITDVDWPNEEN